MAGLIQEMIGWTTLNRPIMSHLDNVTYHPKKRCSKNIPWKLWVVISSSTPSLQSQINSTLQNEYLLVGGIPTPLKNMRSSVGMMTFPTEWKIKFMFQTTNQAISPLFTPTFKVLCKKSWLSWKSLLLSTALTGRDVIGWESWRTMVTFFFSVPWSSYMWAMVIPGFAHLEKTHTIPYGYNPCFDRFRKWW